MKSWERQVAETDAVLLLCSPRSLSLSSVDTCRDLPDDASVHPRAQKGSKVSQTNFTWNHFFLFRILP